MRKPNNAITICNCQRLHRLFKCTIRRHSVRRTISILNQETNSIYKYKDAQCIVADKLLTCMLKHIFLLVPLADITGRMSYPDGGRRESPVFNVRQVQFGRYVKLVREMEKGILSCPVDDIYCRGHSFYSLRNFVQDTCNEYPCCICFPFTKEIPVASLKQEQIQCIAVLLQPPFISHSIQCYIAGVTLFYCHRLYFQY